MQLPVELKNIDKKSDGIWKCTNFEKYSAFRQILTYIS
jgi:hypothetical protein